MSEAANPAARDVRVDQLGIAAELQKQHVDNLTSAVKVRMTGEGLDTVEGDYFVGQLVETTVTTIDPGKLLALYTKDKISRAQLLSALTVNKEPLKKFLSGGEIEKLGTTTAGTPQLRVTRMTPTPFKLVDALKGLVRLNRRQRCDP